MKNNFKELQRECERLKGKMPGPMSYIKDGEGLVRSVGVYADPRKKDKPVSIAIALGGASDKMEFTIEEALFVAEHINKLVGTE
jgi:hypothetical protein